MQNRLAALLIVDSVTDRPESQIANRTRALRIRSTAQNGGIENRWRLISVYALVIISYKNVHPHTRTIIHFASLDSPKGAMFVYRKEGGGTRNPGIHIL